jgi:hypothetical protein
MSKSATAKDELNSPLHNNVPARADAAKAVSKAILDFISERVCKKKEQVQTASAAQNGGGDFICWIRFEKKVVLR